MATFLLVHGGWHGGWCWEKLTPLLEAAGQRVLAPDLPGHGTKRNADEERPWQRYVPFLCDLIDGEATPPILVGHSSGGMLISEIAAQRPQRVALLVYLAAFLLPPGESPPEVMRADQESLLARSLLVDPVRGTTSIKPDCAREVFYGDCTDEDAAWAIAHLQPEPIIPTEERDAPASLARAAAVPRVYIETTQDRALGPTTQRRMYTALPCRTVLSLPTSHSPFISAPEALARELLSLV